MFFLSRPTESRIQRFRAEVEGDAFSYPEIGATVTGSIPSGYNLDHNRVRLGEGRESFLRAHDALHARKMFDIGWVTLMHPDAPVIAGQTVLILARTLGFFSLSASRVIAMIDQDNGQVWRRGFSYGTLRHQVERGEERFSVEYHHRDESVWYDLLAFSVPQHPMARLGYPLSRMAQRRFAVDSKAAMLKAVR